MFDWREVIKEETEKCQMTTFPTEDGKSTYPYIILPFESRITKRFIKAVVEGMTEMLTAEIEKATAIVLPEAKGFLLSPIADATGLDLALIRKRDYRMPNQVAFEQRKGYKEKEGKTFMYCIGLKKGDKPLIIDDIISSGLTHISIINGLKGSGFDIAGIGIVYERGNGIENVKKETGFTVKALARLIDTELPGEIVKRPFVSRVLNTTYKQKYRT